MSTILARSKLTPATKHAIRSIVNTDLAQSGIKNPSITLPIIATKSFRSAVPNTHASVSPNVETHIIPPPLPPIFKPTLAPKQLDLPLSPRAILEPVEQANEQELQAPLYHYGGKFDRVPYWQAITRWRDISEEQFLTYEFNVSYSILLSSPSFRVLSAKLARSSCHFVDLAY